MLEKTDLNLYVPLYGQAESLNVAVAVRHPRVSLARIVLRRALDFSIIEHNISKTVTEDLNF